ncbi:CPBP family intramembrane glutamic endopeptidase [Paucibacter sp. XJ19-41]|uniref:CPBP family intramembrane glutamic endopeptidase n=1 Tax=Paucibacter sp. XJ19-41 TaxID=2927824 RepID=UPI002349B37F|nr:CPBP family intramembrane glutamic endopeptidase [Paucibacter sp. XJ19-41]MDC6167444.1 CPBP family intramembrane metalloprotease [Paucibacter sp. XJ19-41]
MSRGSMHGGGRWRGMGGRRRRIEAAGLLLALAGPAGVAACSQLLLPLLGGLGAALLGLLLLWLLATGLIGLARRLAGRYGVAWGCRPPGWWSVVLGIAAGLLLQFVLAPVAAAWVVPAAMEPGLALLRDWPRPLLVAAALSAGIVEEICYRGYAQERLAGLTGRMGVAALVVIPGFAAAHVVTWGVGMLPYFMITGAALTALYAWRRDLLLNMLAHGTAAVLGVWSVGGA